VSWPCASILSGVRELIPRVVEARFALGTGVHKLGRQRRQEGYSATFPVKDGGKHVPRIGGVDEELLVAWCRMGVCEVVRSLVGLAAYACLPDLPTAAHQARWLRSPRSSALHLSSL
jgi:hypothetical protein